MAEYEAFRDVKTPQYLRPCGHCGRNFNPETLARHEKVCSSLKQRKVFDSRKQRVEEFGPELKNVKKTIETKEPVKKKKKADWRSKHETLIATLKAARGDGPALAPVVDPGYVECPHCNRNFNEHAAERHIPFCKDQKARQQMKNPTAKAKLNVRTQYKPPLPGSKKSNPSLAPEGGGFKQRTPNRGAQPQGSSSAGSVKYSPAQQSPGMRRRIDSDQSDQIDQRALRRKASPSPPPQRRNQLGSTRTLESNSNNNNKYQGMEYQNAHRVSSGSSSDSDVRRVGSGHNVQQHDPSWFKDLKKTENNSIFPENNRKKSSAGSTGRHSGRTRENPSGDVFKFDEKPIKPKRRNELDDEEFLGYENRPTAVGVVRPSSRKASETSEGRAGSGRRKLANFCHECGTKYPVENAKFCCECGIKRMHIEV